MNRVKNGKPKRWRQINNEKRIGWTHLTGGGGLWRVFVSRKAARTPKSQKKMQCVNMHLRRWSREYHGIRAGCGPDWQDLLETGKAWTRAYTTCHQSRPTSSVAGSLPPIPKKKDLPIQNVNALSSQLAVRPEAGQFHEMRNAKLETEVANHNALVAYSRQVEPSTDVAAIGNIKGKWAEALLVIPTGVEHVGHYRVLMNTKRAVEHILANIDCAELGPFVELWERMHQLYRFHDLQNKYERPVADWRTLCYRAGLCFHQIAHGRSLARFETQFQITLQARMVCHSQVRKLLQGAWVVVRLEKDNGVVVWFQLAYANLSRPWSLMLLPMEASSGSVRVARARPGIALTPNSPMSWSNTWKPFRVLDLALAYRLELWRLHVESQRRLREFIPAHVEVRRWLPRAAFWAGHPPPRMKVLPLLAPPKASHQLFPHPMD